MHRFAAMVLLGGCGFAHGVAGESRDASIAIDTGLDDAPNVPTCSDGVKNGSESDIDCGGSCSPCAVTKTCNTSSDCAASVCGPNIGKCRYAYSCKELHVEQSALTDGPYQLDPDGLMGAAAFGTYCDMTTDGGGWTLVGKVDGRFDMYSTWLISIVNPTDMLNPTIGTNTYASVDAITLAVDRSTEIRLSNSARTHWVKWPLPASRATGTFWRHTVGQSTVGAAPQPSVTATASDGTTGTCYQNEYGILPYNMHGGGYPALGRNAAGNTIGSDLCMVIGTQTTTSAVDGFSSNGNQFDAPVDETTWPNTAYNVTPHVAVWLR